MGHSIDYRFLEADTKESALKEGYSEACVYALDNGDIHEGSTSYHGNFKYYDKVFDNEDDALEFFDNLGPYQDGIVQVKEASNSSRKRYNETEWKYRQKQLDLVEKCRENFKKRTSKTVGCKNCGTRLTKEEAYKNRLFCPNCRNWMVSDSVKNRYKKYAKQIELAKERLSKDQAQNGKLRYFAKFEIHV